MKRHFILASALAATLATTSFSSFAAVGQADLMGEAVPASAATKTITIGPDTHYVNVTGGQVIKFIVGDKTFTWDFDVAGSIFHMTLNQIAPAGVLDHNIDVYIAPDPTYTGGA